MELLRQSNEMQRGMSAQIEALKAQITSRRPEHKGLTSPPRTVLNPTAAFWDIKRPPTVETVTQDMLRCPDAPVKNTQADAHHHTGRSEQTRGSRVTNCIQRSIATHHFRDQDKKNVRLDRWTLSSMAAVVAWHWEFSIPRGPTARIVWPQPSLSWIPASAAVNGGQGRRLRFWLLFVDTGGGTSVFHYRKWPYERKRPYESQEN